MKPFREALAEIMSSRDLEQLELAVNAEVSEAAISLYLSGKRRPRPTTMEKLARALGVEPEYFLEYRQAKAEQLVREAMARGEIDLDDIELIIERHRFMKEKEDRGQ